LFLREK